MKKSDTSADPLRVRLDPLDLHVTDIHAVDENVATNARTFCLALALICLATAHAHLALLAIMPIGLSCFVDRMRNGPARVVAVVGTYTIAVCAFALAMLIR